VHPREVFAPALRELAAAIIVAHNHPSGDPEPSMEDIEVTKRLSEAGKLLGVPLLDHIIVGEGGSFTSLRERLSL
jgi:DNA repair protein RadC